jgi:putative transposase
MTRPIRIQLEAAFYHIISKGNRDEFIFPATEDKDYFLQQLGKGAEKYRVFIYAYCVMGNHYHLLVQTMERNLAEFMHYLGSSYASYCARKDWKGHIFWGRYKSICVDAEEYLLTLSRYIHLNPVEARIVERPQDYRWSSYRYYVRKKSAPSWLERDWLKDYFGPGDEGSRKRYREFVEGKVSEPNDYPHEKVTADSILGDSEFVQGVIGKVVGGLKSEEVTNRKILLKRVTLEQVYNEVCRRYGLGGIRDTNKGVSVAERNARWLFLFCAKRYTPSSNREIGEMIGDMGPHAVSSQHRRICLRLDRDGNFRDMFVKGLEEMEKRLEI